MIPSICQVKGRGKFNNVFFDVERPTGGSVRGLGCANLNGGLPVASVWIPSPPYEDGEETERAANEDV